MKPKYNVKIKYFSKNFKYSSTLTIEDCTKPFADNFEALLDEFEQNLGEIDSINIIFNNHGKIQTQ